MIDSNYLVFLHKEILPYIETVGIFEIVKINNLPSISCSKVILSSLPGFVDLTPPILPGQDAQAVEFVASLPAEHIVCIYWVDNKTLNKILGFHSGTGSVDNIPDQLNHS